MNKRIIRMTLMILCLAGGRAFAYTDALEDRLYAVDRSTRYAALQELTAAPVSYKLQLAPKLLSDLRADFVQYPLTALVAISQEPLCQQVLISRGFELVRSPEPNLRASGRFLLASMGQAVHQALDRALLDTDPRFLIEIIYTIDELADARPLIPSLASAMRHGDKDVRAAAMTALYTMGGEGLREAEAWGKLNPNEYTPVMPNKVRINPERIPGVFTGYGLEGSGLPPARVVAQYQGGGGPTGETAFEAHQRDANEFVPRMQRIRLLIYAAIGVVFLWLCSLLFRWLFS